MTTILQLQTTNDGKMVSDIITALASDTSISETDRTVFNQLNTDGYGAMFDDTLVAHYGERILRPAALSEYLSVPFWKVNITAYMKRHAAYFRHCLEYIAAEYNPIENVFSEEHEETSTTHGERHSCITDTDEPRTISTEYEKEQKTKEFTTPQIITEDYAEANIIKKTERGDDTVTNQNTPFEGDAWHNQTKTTDAYGDITETEQPYNRKFKTPEYTTTDVEFGYTDTVTEKHEADEVSTHDTLVDEAIDTFERDTSRHGNVGTMSSAELIEKDANVWRAFGWIYDTAHDIANIISVGVIAL